MSPIFLLNWLIERLHSNILSHNTQEHNNISPFSVSIIVGNFLATVLYTLPRILWCACAGCAVTGILLWFTFHCWRHAYVTMTSLSNSSSSSSSIDVDTGRPISSWRQYSNSTDALLASTHASSDSDGLQPIKTEEPITTEGLVRWRSAIGLIRSMLPDLLYRSRRRWRHGALQSMLRCPTGDNSIKSISPQLLWTDVSEKGPKKAWL